MATKFDGIRFNALVVDCFIASSRIVGCVLTLLALALLLTWLTGAGPLRPLVLLNAGNHAGTALGFLLGGIALLLGRPAPRASVFLSVLLAVLGVIGLLEFALGAEVMVWQWLDGFLPHWQERPVGRMSTLAALAFTLLGIAGTEVALGRGVWLREAALLAVIALATAASASYGLVLAGDSANLLQRLPIITALMLLLLALGWMASVPTTGLTRVTVADSVGGAFARRLILPALLLPVVLTFVFRIVQSQWGMSESLALALAAVATGGSVTVMIIWVAFLLDRSERQRRTEVSLRQDASTDVLTGLANRRMFDVTLVQALHDTRADTSVLLMLDIDHFKKFNDSFGHPVGDEVLREAGHLLRSAVRLHDTVARYGGEEFVILLPHSDAQRAERVSHRILTAFRGHEWGQRAVTISIGAAVAMPVDTPEELLRRADEALYRSKQEGRDRLTFANDVVVQPRLPVQA